MPTYDYICTACGHRMEVVHGIHSQHPDACPLCGGTMRKAPTAPAVHFKGSGWAKKDRGAATATKAAAKAGGEADTTVTKKSHDGDASSSTATDTASSASEPKTPAPTTTSGAD